MTYADDGKKNWTELKAKMAAGGMPTQADQLGALHAFARIFRDKGPLSDLLSENLLDWFEGTMPDENCNVWEVMVDAEAAACRNEILLTKERDRVDTLTCHIADLRQQLQEQISRLKGHIVDRDQEIVSFLTEQDVAETLKMEAYKMVVVWAANGDITREQLRNYLNVGGIV